MLHSASPVSSFMPMPLPEVVEPQPDWFGAGFAADLAFMTCDGIIPTAWLRPGDLLQTLDNGMQPLALVERQTIEPGLMVQSDGVANGAPLSASQRALVCGGTLELHFGHREMLVALGALSATQPRKMISAQPTYILAFEQPQLIHCDGLWLEASSMAAEQPARPHMTGIEARAIGLAASDLSF